MTDFHLDYETASSVNLKVHGLDRYLDAPDARVLMCAGAFDDDEPTLWEAHHGEPFPREWRKALLSRDVKKWGFNSSFERLSSRRLMDIRTPYQGWRCSMVLGHMQSFVGDLALMGERVMLPMDKQKMADGKRLIKKFTMPQKVRKNQPHEWLDWETDPEDWELFGEYCVQDVVSERSIKKRLLTQKMLESEWELYEIDQIINDRGIPIDPIYVQAALDLSAQRKIELTELLQRKTNYELGNVNSPKQIMGWLKERGYPFNDLKKDTVKKVIMQCADEQGAKLVILEDDVVELETIKPGGTMTPQGLAGLQLRQQLARTSTAKYTAILKALGRGNRFRGGFQFGGAARTNRWAGRRLNPQNLARMPSVLEIGKAAQALGVPVNALLDLATQMIRDGDYEGLKLLVDEPLNVLAGLVRSAIRVADEDEEELCAADLSSIETVTSAWLTNCTRLLDVFKSGKDAYIDFAQFMFKKSYEEVTKPERQKAKPAVLGACYRLGGGRLIEGKRTGLWGYAEAMGVDLTEKESADAVALYRKIYVEIERAWFAIEKAVAAAMQSGGSVVPVIKVNGNHFRMPITIQKEGPYLTIKLPSGRRLFYYKPRMVTKTFRGRPTEEYPLGEPYKRTNLTYMGKQQNGNAWKRIDSHGGKLFENIVQAVARDILAVGIRRAHDFGYKIVMHVHDEIVALIKKGSNIHTVGHLCSLMTATIPWCADMPLKAAGWHAPFYRKD